MQMSSRYVRCAPNAVDDRMRDHHADRSSVLGTCFWPLIVRQDAPIVPSTAGTDMPLADASYRASGLVLWHFSDMPTALRDVRFQGQSGKHMLFPALTRGGRRPACTVSQIEWRFLREECPQLSWSSIRLG